jgi:DNA polymerase-3 subunit gamma/tau
MDYVVLARKLRPTRFAELIGQETVVRALRNAIATDRVAHAFLFAGARGVGKTSAARILTKALNCLAPQDGEPCNACENCREIAAGSAPDVYEIDAASNRGIDSIRELRENTKFSPVKCRYKTYIIDEVHMLTTESFNALLKTLEEPPPHIKFILATTNPHKIPETILSRCQRFDFPRIPTRLMADYLSEVTAREGLSLSRAALETLARNAAGGLRDALTAVDQVVSYGGPQASDEQVLSILGLMDNREVFALLGAVLERSLPAALEAFAAIRGRGHDLESLLEALIREVKDFALYLTLAGEERTFADALPDTLAFYESNKGKATLDELQQLFYLFLELEQQLKRSDFAQACFEMALVKACRVQPLVGVSELLAQVRELARLPAGGEGGAPRPPPAVPEPARSTRPAATDYPPPAPAPRHARERGPAGPGGGGTGSGGRGRESGEEGEEAEPAPPAGSGERHRATPPGDFPQAPAPRDRDRPPLRANGPAPDPPERPGGDPTRTAAEQLAEPALCDDPRWRAFVERVATDNPKGAADLRRMEVVALGAEAVVVILPDRAAALSAAEWERVTPALREAFAVAADGPLHIRSDDDKLGQARFAHTITGRRQLEQEARLAALRAEAAGDETVRRLRRYFPGSRIVEIRLNESDAPDGRDLQGNDDVQG